MDLLKINFDFYDIFGLILVSILVFGNSNSYKTFMKITVVEVIGSVVLKF